MDTRDVGAFAVLNFSLAKGDDGQPIQRTASCGTFVEVERAFAVARARAWQEVSERRSQYVDTASDIHVLDTEWGYDVRADSLVVSRYWVHDRTPSCLTS